MRNREELTATLEEIFRQQPSEYWLKKFDAAGVPSGPINRLEAVFDEPQVVHNQSIISLVHPVHGEYPVPNNPIRMHGTPTRPRGYAPRLGEHSREVLADFGLDQEQIDRLVEHGVVSVFEE